LAGGLNSEKKSERVHVILAVARSSASNRSKCSWVGFIVCCIDTSISRLWRTTFQEMLSFFSGCDLKEPRSPDRR
jgi:hypothetical protein